MHISEYMAANSLRDADMAELIGCERSYVLKLRQRSAKPSAAMMATIAEKTGGQVEPNDWFELPGQAQAA